MIMIVISHIAGLVRHFQNLSTESENNPTKGKPIEKKELGHMTRIYMPRGSQSLTENIIEQF